MCCIFTLFLLVFDLVDLTTFVFQELDHKFQQTAAYRNMKKMLMDKNVKIKDLRSKLSQYEKDDIVEED